MGSFSSLSKTLRQQAKNIEGNANLLVRRVSYAILEELAIRTPIDTGMAKSNWIVTINKQTIAVIEPHYFGIHGSTNTQTIKTVQERGKYAIQQYKNGDTIYIQNNTPYIDDLESGKGSKQAPNGFVRQSIARANPIIEGTQILKYNGVPK